MNWNGTLYPARRSRHGIPAGVHRALILKLCGFLVPVYLFSTVSWAAEGPFFITYTHQMEEAGNLEFAAKSALGHPNGGSRFFGTAAELEYGMTGWWTTELYMDGQTTAGQSTLLTGYRWENRFRLVPGERWINPVLYIEFENINGADKTLLEIVNHDGNDDLTDPTATPILKRSVNSKPS